MPVVPYVSIIIPTYNRARMLPITLDSFIAQEYPHDRFEIIVANNNSADETKQVLDGYCSRHSQFKAILEPRQGVHYARNTAARMARGEILYFTDDDMIADRHLLSELMKVFDLDPRIATATGKIIGKFDVSPPEWVKRHLINYYLSLTELDRPEQVIVSPDDLVFSCHQAIRREPFFQCGGFNPENTAGVWIGDGETGLGIKLKHAGYKFAFRNQHRATAIFAGLVNRLLDRRCIVCLSIAMGTVVIDIIYFLLGKSVCTVYYQQYQERQA